MKECKDLEFALNNIVKTSIQETNISDEKLFTNKILYSSTLIFTGTAIRSIGAFFLAILIPSLAGNR